MIFFNFTFYIFSFSVAFECKNYFPENVKTNWAVFTADYMLGIISLVTDIQNTKITVYLNSYYPQIFLYYPQLLNYIEGLGKGVIL